MYRVNRVQGEFETVDYTEQRKNITDDIQVEVMLDEQEKGEA